MLKHNRNVLILIGVGIVLVGVVLGIFVGRTPKSTVPEKGRELSDISFAQSSAHATPEAEPSGTPDTQIYYTVQSKDGHLNIYKVCGTEKNLIKRVEFDLELLPQTDKDTLEKGIRVQNLEEGFQLLEDFTS